ncbi:hypothetical protein T492DRAFT_994376 [Pavlovales sp. CCMP2436]|nr:hypothetical protein T492DRAFT_994376 [Pavlovales sp. CCMP2436]
MKFTILALLSLVGIAAAEHQEPHREPSRSVARSHTLRGGLALPGGGGAGDGLLKKTADGLLKKNGLSRNLLPADVSLALRLGRLSLEQLRNYIVVLRNPLSRALASLSPFLRDRLIHNPQLTNVILIETCLGIVTMLIAEVGARGDTLLAEIDFVVCDLALVVATNIALVITLSPAVALTPAPTKGLSGAFAKLPSSALQPGKFSLAQRAGCFANNAVRFGAIGVASSTLGASATKGLVLLREKLTNERPPIELAPVLSTALAYGAFTAVSSSTRYQLVNAIEASVLTRLPFPTGSISALLRFGNNFLGGVSWIMWARFLGIQ